MPEPTYEDYVRDESFISDYLAYQARWSTNARESDRVIIEHVANAVEALPSAGREPHVVDIGCSTGNLLKHLRSALPDVRLSGSDYSPESVATCRADPALAGMAFETVDIVQMAAEDVFDVAVVNAVLYLLDQTDFDAALRGLARSLRPGGTLVVFDFFHPFRQDLSIIERSRSHPDGLPIHFRSMAEVEASLGVAGFSSVRFEPFEIPIDLEEGAPHGDNRSGFEDLNSYTVRAEDGRRLLFRGTLFQPWCHLIAVKAA